MNQIFIKAKSQTNAEGILLIYTCINGAEGEGSLQLPAGTTYVTGNPIKNAQNLMFCTQLDGTLVPGFYPYGSPQGDIELCRGGGGKGHLTDLEQHGVTRFPGQEELSGFGTKGRGMVVSWINGINMTLMVSNISDPDIDSIPNGVEVYFHLDINDEGVMDIPVVSMPVMGSCDNPG